MKTHFLTLLLISLLCVYCNDSVNNNNKNQDKNSNNTIIVETTPETVVRMFIKYLGKQDYRSAFELQDNPAWGDYEKFSSEKAFGGIDSTNIIEIEEKGKKDGYEVVYVEAFYSDPINGSKTYEENFYLKETEEDWIIKKITVEKVKSATNNINVKPVVIAEKDYESICFSTNGKKYPQIYGLSDKNFQVKINNTFKNCVLDFIEESKQACACSDQLPGRIMGWATVDFEYYKNDNILSIIIFLTNGFGGGNMWNPGFETFNIDIVNNEIISSTEIIGNRTSTEEINYILKNFFVDMYPENEFEPNYPKVNDYKKLDYIVKNGKIHLIITAYPGAHVSFSVYQVPITKF